MLELCLKWDYANTKGKEKQTEEKSFDQINFCL